MLPTLLGAAVSLLVMAGLLVPLEGWFPIVPERLRLRAGAICVALFVANTLLMHAVGAPVLEALEAAVGSSEPPSWARWVAVLVLADIAGYWAHRAMHRVPVLWRIHAVHHAPTRLNWLEAWRQHPIDFLIHGIAVGLPGALLGASLADLSSVVLVRKVSSRPTSTPTCAGASARWTGCWPRPSSTGSTTARTGAITTPTSRAPSPGSTCSSAPTDARRTSRQRWAWSRTTRPPDTESRWFGLGRIAYRGPTPRALGLSRGLSPRNVSGGTPEAVELLRDGAPLAKLIAPYQYMWDTSSVPEGEYTLIARATRGKASVSSSSLQVVVDRTPPSITSRTPTPGSEQEWSGAISFTTSEPLAAGTVNDTGVQLMAGGTILLKRLTLSADGKTVQVLLAEPLNLPRI